MQLFVGTSGYSYKEWKGTFYPEKIPADQMLSYYAERLPAVEINNTFYRMPKTSVLESWAEQVPPEFRFVLKASQRITHQKRLNDIDEPLEILTRNASSLRERLGALLFQLPPNLAKNSERLETFLNLLAPQARAAIEFRHAGWFDEEVYALLRSKSCALCIDDFEDSPQTEIVSTASWGYLRLRRVNYSDDDLKQWLERVRAQPWETAYVFFKHEDAGTGPKLATKFLELAAQSP